MFKHLRELLEAEDLVGGAMKPIQDLKAGYGRTRDRFDKEAGKTKGEQDKAKADADREAAKNKAAVSKATAKAIKDDLKKFTDNFFDQFPNYDGDVESSILEKYQDRPSLKAAVTAFNGVGKKLDELRTAFNKAIVNATGVNGKLVAKYAQIEDSSEPPRDEIEFVQGEAMFFKNLFRYDDDFQINDTAFKQLLSAKVNETEPKYRNKAVENLNILFSFMSAQFREYANTIATAGAKLPKEAVKEDENDAADKAAERVKNAAAARKEQEREADKKNREAEVAAKKAVDAEEKIKDKAAKEAEAAIKASAADHKASTADAIQELRKDLEGFTRDMIDSFPFDGAMTTEDAMSKFPTREAALAAFKAYRGIAERIDQILAGLNRSLVSAGKVRDEQVKRYTVQAQRMLKGGNPAVPGQLVRFVKAESKFFKQLIQIDDDMKLDGEEFKDRLTIKINQTDPARVPDAAQALTLLFSYISAKYKQNARTIADVGRSMDDENVTVKKTARDAAAATAAAEVEARAKSNGR